mmetsp:Transcript_18207/g.23467  ORF Transcript_18207/g.23467 Transcript_18207/m.23467 type:complete len:550 (+) Transcript_18207:150-1799(+)
MRFLPLVPVVVFLLNACVGFGQEGEQQPVDAAAAASNGECISPLALQDCRDSLNDNDQIVIEWRNKLNMAVQAVHDERESFLQEKTSAHVLELEQRQGAHQLELNKMSTQTKESQDLQDEIIKSNQAQAVEAAKEEEREHWNFELEKEREETNVKWTRALEEQSAALTITHEKDKQTALQLGQETHTAAWNLLTIQKSKSEELHKTCLDHHKQVKFKLDSNTNELLQARQELLKANEIVRLYELGFHNRWFVMPATLLAKKVWEMYLEPIGDEFYKVAHPIVDPFYEHVVTPATPYFVLAVKEGRVLVNVALEALGNGWTLFLQHAAQTFEFLKQEIPPMVQEFTNWAGPKIQQASSITYNACLDLYSTTISFFKTTIDPMVKEHFTDPIWNAQVVPFYKQKVQPLLEQHVRKVQPFLLKHFTHFVQFVDQQVQVLDQNNPNIIPESVVQFVSHVANHPQESLVSLETGLLIIPGLILLRFYIFIFLWIFGFNKKKQIVDKKSNNKNNNNGKRQPPKPEATKKNNTNGKQQQQQQRGNGKNKQQHKNAQ